MEQGTLLAYILSALCAFFTALCGSTGPEKPTPPTHLSAERGRRLPGPPCCEQRRRGPSPAPCSPAALGTLRASCPLRPSLSLKACRWEPFEAWVLLSEGLVQACRREGAGGVGEKAGLDQGKMPTQMCALSVHWGLSRGAQGGAEPGPAPHL